MFLVLAAAVAVAPIPSATADRAAIETAMADSAAGWNAGDLDRFVRVYADDAIYVTRDGVVRGRPVIAARYRPTFAATGNTRGRLTFEAVAFRTISPAHQLLVARWKLTGGPKDEAGMTTLLFERRREGWRIVSDHSS